MSVLLYANRGVDWEKPPALREETNLLTIIWQFIRQSRADLHLYFPWNI